MATDTRAFLLRRRRKKLVARGVEIRSKLEAELQEVVDRIKAIDEELEEIAKLESSENAKPE